ncbi:hypothetical protein GCWU000324_03164 [Kingella oralis ATCC 51147]|uniref:Uncharacterized protein n=1 Tax=Kingella oralis ATCC 51147 TaxID=629741 RepID=C4GN75_9NEIS|nr:hypothetical protein GCWU000324_03164 [Kingella oralis ATCC 51147]
MVNSRKQGQIVYLPFFGFFQAALMRISRGSLKTMFVIEC